MITYIVITIVVALVATFLAYRNYVAGKEITTLTAERDVQKNSAEYLSRQLSEQK